MYGTVQWWLALCIISNGMKLFSKDKKGKKPPKASFAKGGKTETPEEFRNVEAAEQTEAAVPKVLPKEYGVLKGFYISEKASGLASFNQYVFKVFDGVTKNEIKKQVENSFSVKVKGVKIINLPRKRRSVGRHVGFKSGFKKAIVVLEKGHSIEGFQP